MKNHFYQNLNQHQNSIFALVDCNNFYASCERVFRPDLQKTPIVVLSNNDGCIIARSNEAKALGIEMGAPFFKFRQLIEKNKVAVFSSNYSFYGDMSSRVMRSLQMMVPDLEIYSIDEAFLRLDNIAFDDILNLCQKLRFNINKWLGIPTSIGIAGTKTLAKIANQIAKKNLYNLAPNHICDFRNSDLQQEVLEKFAVQDVWGIGKGITTKLKAIGIDNALQLANSNPKQIRKILGVVGERIVYELNGISCLHLSEIAPKKNILSSKSFGKIVTAKADLQEAIANYAVRACEKMRRQNSLAQGICVYIRTNPFANKPQYCAGRSIGFAIPTNNVSEILKSALKILDQIYQKNYQYKKAGIMLLDLIDEGSNIQENLFDNDLFAKNSCQNNSDFFDSGDNSQKKKTKSELIQKTMEKINKDFNKNTIFYAVQGTKRSWAMQCNKRSMHYTTNIKELARVF